MNDELALTFCNQDGESVTHLSLVMRAKATVYRKIAILPVVFLPTFLGSVELNA